MAKTDNFYVHCPLLSFFPSPSSEKHFGVLLHQPPLSTSLESDQEPASAFVQSETQTHTVFSRVKLKPIRKSCQMNSSGYVTAQENSKSGSVNISLKLIHTGAKKKNPIFTYSVRFVLNGPTRKDMARVLASSMKTSILCKGEVLKKKIPS